MLPKQARGFAGILLSALLLPGTLLAQRCYPPVLDFADQRDVFGTSVALRGNHAAVLAAGDQAVYVYTRAGGAWQRSARLSLPTVEAPLSSDSLWINDAGNELLVGSPASDVGPVLRAGAVLVYRRDAVTGAWQLQASLSADVPQANAYFGGRLVVEGDTLVVGSHLHDVDGVNDAGAAFLFRRSTAGDFQNGGRLVDPTPTVGGRFGFALSAASGRVIVGANGDLVGAQSAVGSAHVFSLESPLPLLQSLNRPTAQVFAQFGGSVAASGSRLIVTDAFGSSPSVFHYTWDGTQYAPAALPALGLMANEVPRDSALTGDVLALGIVPGTIGGAERILIVDLAAQQARTIASPVPGSGLDALPSFGSSLAFHGDTLLAGAAGVDVGALRDQGEAWFFTLSDGSVIRRARHGSGRAPAQFASSLAPGQGPRVWVGEPGFDGNREDAGRVVEWVALGDGWMQGRATIGPDSQTGFGSQIALAANYLVVGANTANVDGVPARGRVFVRRILEKVLTNTCELQPQSDATVQQFGALIATSGDRVAVAHGPIGNRRVHLYRVANDTCLAQGTITASSLGTTPQGFAAGLTWVGDHLAISDTRIVPPTSPGRVFILAPQGDSFALLTTLSQNASPATVAAMGTALASDNGVLAVSRPPGSINGVPVTGAVLTWRRDGQSYTSIGTAVDPAMPGSLAASRFGSPLIRMSGDTILIPNRNDAGQAGFLRVNVQQPSVMSVGGNFGTVGPLAAIAIVGDRTVAGMPSNNLGVATRGSLLSARTVGDNLTLLPSLEGSRPEVLHCADQEAIED